MYPSIITIIIVVMALLVLYVTGRSLAYVFKTTEEKLKSEPSVLTELDELRRSLNVKTTMYEMAEFDLIGVKDEFAAYKKYVEGYISEMETALLSKDTKIAELENSNIKELSTKLWHSRRVVAKLKRDLISADIQIKELGDNYNRTKAESSDLQAMYNSVLAKYAECKVKLDAIEQAKPAPEPKPDISGLEWAKWVATNKDGVIQAFELIVKKASFYPSWVTEEGNGNRLIITEAQAITLCGRVPKWSDDYPTPCL